MRASVFIAAAVLAVSSMSAYALPWQVKAAQPNSHQKQAPPVATPGFSGQPGPALTAPQHNPSFQVNGPGPHRGDWLRKYFSLPANQQEQQLRQDPSFRTLPSDRQQQLLNRLREFNSKPPEKKQQILNRMETYEHMTPEQQKSAQNLFQQYRNLPGDERSKVSQAYRRLRGMPPQQRSELMNSDEFRSDYTDEERELLRGMTDLNVGPTRPE